MPLRALAAVLVWLLMSGAAPAAGECANIDHEGRQYTVCGFDAGKADLRVWLRADDGSVHGSFQRLRQELAARGERLWFAMNAGMYHPDRQPVGLYVEDGEEQARLVTSAGPGNFGMLPNGVFCIGKRRFAVIESRRYAKEQPTCRHATQSGPMLVIDGALHPRFLPGSTSRFVRNGVGVSADGRRVWFAISRGQVTFHEFARLFRDALGARDALYFDGNVSRLHAEALGRSDFGRQMGPIVGLALPAER